MILKFFKVIFILFLLIVSCTDPFTKYTEISDFPVIYPDYKGAVIPVNIAPLNFRVEYEIRKIVLVIEGGEERLEFSGKNKINIPVKKWHNLLKENSNDSLSLTVFTLKDKIWTKYMPFYIHVKTEPIDPWLVYRLIDPGYESWSEMGIFQRNVTSFKVESLIDTRVLPGNCMNCHSFNQNNPEQMIFHLRGKIGGTLFAKDNEIQKVITRNIENNLNCVYPFWHSSGKYIAFSVNNIFQGFHSTGEKRIEVYDTESDVVVYDIDNHVLITSDLINSKGSFETFPVFTPDGSSLIFCSAESNKMPDEYENIKYNLCKISFNADDGTFGKEVDTLIKSETIARSISFPRVSPNGKYLMFTASYYGNFSIWHKEADLYLLNLETGAYCPIDVVNSEDTESYHSWSSGSDWFVFSSRRENGLYTQPYISYIDKNGTVGKPFLLPQRDPDFYSNCLQSFNVPEFIKSKVKLDRPKMLKKIKSPGKNIDFDLR